MGWDERWAGSEISGFAVAARAYVLWMQRQGKHAVGREVSGGEAVERKGTVVREAGADDAVEETCSLTRPG